MSDSNRFFPLDASVLLRQNGVFSEHQIYQNEDHELFARKGNGYLRLMDNQATSASRVFWSDLVGVKTAVKVGKLILVRGPYSKAA